MKSRAKLLSSIKKNIKRIAMLQDKVKLLSERDPSDSRITRLIRNYESKYPVNGDIVNLDYDKLAYADLMDVLTDSGESLRNLTSAHHGIACGIAKLPAKLTGTLRINNHKPDL